MTVSPLASTIKLDEPFTPGSPVGERDVREEEREGEEGERKTLVPFFRLMAQRSINFFLLIFLIFLHIMPELRLY